MTTAREDDDLIPTLLHAAPEDLSVLVDYITDSGKGRISLANETMSCLIEAKGRREYTDAERRLIAHEIQLFGGNTFANLARGGQGVTYIEIARDVASRLKAKTSPSARAHEVEESILQVVVEKAWDQMSPAEREQFAKSAGIQKFQGAGEAALAAIIVVLRGGGFASYRIAASVASAVARQLLGRGLAFGAVAPAMQGMAVIAGPIGWVITALWAGFDLASPGYRVTVPCVLQVAYIRRKLLGFTMEPNS